MFFFLLFGVDLIKVTSKVFFKKKKKLCEKVFKNSINILWTHTTVSHFIILFQIYKKLSFFYFIFDTKWFMLQNKNAYFQFKTY